MQDYEVVLTHKFKALFDAKSVVEMAIVAAQHQIGLISRRRFELFEAERSF
jgi:hypothetical protein